MLNFKHRNKGQTLIEMVVALGLAIVIVGAISILTISGLKNANQSKDQTLTTELAEQTMSKVTASLKNPECNFKSDLNTNSFWPVDFCVDSSNPVQVKLVSRSDGSACGDDIVNFSNAVPIPGYEAEGYTVDIYVGNPTNPEGICQEGSDYNSYKKVTVDVNWTDSSGDHTTELSSYVSQ